MTGADVTTWMLRGMPKGGYYVSVLWPVLLLAAVSGLAFELAKWAISDVRRHIYNRNRNRKYAESRHGRVREPKNMTWMRSPKKPWNKVPLSPPPGFAEEVCKQWDRAHDSLEEMIKFGKMMIELEDYVDNAFIFDAKGDIVGRHPGIKGFLAGHCPHIGYKTAMRYRILAMKAQEAGAEAHAQCDTMCELEGKLDATLKVPHRRLENPCPYRRCKRRSRRPQGTIYALRAVAHSASEGVDAPSRRRIADALTEIVRELSAG